MRAFDVITSIAATTARLGGGARVGSPGPRPEQTLELFEFEGCPFCRKVREALTVLDLDAMIFPCPKGGPRYREEVRARGGRSMFPYLVDPNTGKELYESDDIVETLFSHYGDGSAPPSLQRGPVANLSSFLASATRFGAGVRYRAAVAPARPLELYSFEASPFCRLVREELCALELPYLLHNVGKGSAGRPAFEKRSGRLMVPYLTDPNTETEMFESADIVRYLRATYAR